MDPLRTQRLLLVPLTLDEASAIAAGIREGRAWAPDYPSEGDVVVSGLVVTAGSSYDATGEVGLLQIRRLDSGAAIGGVGFLGGVRDGEAEIGYGLAESARGQGFAREAVAAVVAHAFLHGVDRVTALTEPSNEPSQRLLRSLDFVADGQETTHDGVMTRWVLPRES